MKGIHGIFRTFFTRKSLEVLPTNNSANARGVCQIILLFFSDTCPGFNGLKKMKGENQPAFIRSKSTKETPEQCKICSKSKKLHYNDVDVVLVSLLRTLNKFQIWFWYFFCCFEQVNAGAKGFSNLTVSVLIN